MSDVEIVPSNDYIYKMKFNPADRRQVKKISFSPSKTRVFEITISIDEGFSMAERLFVGVSLDSNDEVSVTACANGCSTYVILSKKDYWFYQEREMVFREPIDLVFKFWFSSGKSKPTIKSIVDDLKTFIEQDEKISLVGSDGDVQVSKFLLELRSPAMKAMFAHDTKECRELKIDLKDFDCNTLNAYVNFLITDKLDNDSKSTALGLYILADKYHVEGLKEMAKFYIVKNLRQFDSNEVYEVFTKIEPDFVKTTFLKFCNQ